MLTAIKLELCTVKLLARNQYEFFEELHPSAQNEEFF